MNKILILGGASVHFKLVEAAREMGLYTIVTDYLPDSPAKKIANESWMPMLLLKSDQNRKKEVK